MVLGGFGYSKVVRYVIPMVPAAILLFTITFGQAVHIVRSGDLLPGGRIVTWLILGFCAIAVALEIATGILCSFRTNHDLIMPIFGPLL